MGVDILRGRFVVRDNGNYNPVAIISSSNSFCGFGSDEHQCRDFYSVTKHCSLTNKREYVDRETAERCIDENFDGMKLDGKISDSYRGFPKTNAGYKRGFHILLQHEIVN